MATQEEQEKLNAALDAALDELDDDDDDDEIFQDTISSPDDNDNTPAIPLRRDQLESQPRSKEAPSDSKNESISSPPAFIGPPRPPPPPSPQQTDVTPEKFLEDMMQELSNVDSDAAMGDLMGRFLQEMQTQIKSEIAKMETESSSVSSPAKSSNGNVSAPHNKASSSSPGKEEVDAVISNLVEDMTKQAKLDPKEVKSKSTIPSSEEDEMLNSILEGLANLGNRDDATGDFDADAVIDGMMEHLLSKDLMYEPMKQVATRFPSWLNEKRNSLSKEEFAEREKQCICFQRLVQAYETEPDNVTRLMDLMQEAQEYGQPPTEIIQEIAPGIELDAEGMPKLDESGLPFPPNEECCIM